MNPNARISHVFNSLRSTRRPASLLALVALTAAPAAMLLLPGLSMERRKSVLRAQLWLAILCAIYLSQMAFYNGLWPDGTRYDFPGLLYIPAALLIVLQQGIELVPEAAREQARGVARFALGLSLLVAVAVKGYQPIIQFVDSNVKSTNLFVAGVEQMASRLRSHPDRALVIESGNIADYELIYSYEQFLRAYGAKNSIFLRIHGYSVETSRYDQEAKLTGDLVQLSATGTDGFTRLSDLRGFGEKCYSLSLSGPFQTECEPIN
jgi:hypothetical protein